MERQTLLDRQLDLSEFLDIFDEVAIELGLYIDHYSDSWKGNTKPLTFLIWEPSGSVSATLKYTYERGTYLTTDEIKDLLQGAIIEELSL